MIGRIYIIRSKQTNKVYVGSTVETLNIRFSKHKLDKKCTSQKILKYSDATIELVECYECENREQLERREGKYQKQYDCVNERIAGRTRQEYYQDNKQELAEKKKEYREKNKETIAEKKKEHYQNNKEEILEKQSKKFECPCGGKYTHNHKARHFKTKKHIEFLTKQN